MGGANQYRHSSSKRVNVNICERVPSFYQNLCRYQVSCIELREFNNKKKKMKKNTMDKMQILTFVITWPKRGNLMKYLVHRLLLTCSVL